MKLNKKPERITTHEGGTAKRITPDMQLRRSMMACLLWERNAYEDGESVTERITSLITKVSPEQVVSAAIEARNKMYLRHLPLFVAREMARHESHKESLSDLLYEIIQRPDEMTEFLDIYWKDGKQPLSAQVKKGLARAFTKFDEYAFAKYNRDASIKLRDVLFLCHAKPNNIEQAGIWKRLVDGELRTPDTWEVNLSAGSDKKTTWERMIADKKLGGMALLRNLRGMVEVGVDRKNIRKAINETMFKKILPFRFISAAKHAPVFEPELGKAMVRSLSTMDKLPGHTVLLVDVSGSMVEPISSKSDLYRIDAACGLAMLLREICEEIDIYSFSMALKHIPPRNTFALRDAIMGSQEHSGTPLGLAVSSIYATKNQAVNQVSFGFYGQRPVDYKGQALRPDRLIVITDEQSADKVPDPISKGYMINVSTNNNGVGYGAWTHIDGWSENVVRFIQELENDLK